MNLKLICLAVAVVVLGLLYFGPVGAFLHGGQRVPADPSDYYEKLGIIKPGTTIRAPEFTLKTLDGKRWSLQGSRGKVIFLNFWATWCLPCLQEMPTMEKLHRDYKKHGLEVVAVNLREPRGEVRKFIKELGVTFTVLLDNDGGLSQEYGVWSIPLTYIINRKGQFVGKAMGYREWDNSEGLGLFRDLLEKRP